MAFFWVFVLLVAALLLLGHYGLPEKRLSMPPAPATERLLVGAEPWRFEGDSGIAFLICHGFRGSPLHVKPLGEFLHGLGHTAIGVLLPGHGSTVEELAKARFYHWEEHLERRYLAERSRYRKIFLIGFSMGGTVCLQVAARNATSFRPAGIITISSPVFFNGLFNGRWILHQPGTALSGILRHVQPIVRLPERPQTGERMSPSTGYIPDIPMDTLHSFKRALAGVRQGLRRISVPYCSIMAANDRTVSAENQSYIHGRIQSRDKRAYMFILPPDLSTMHALLTHVRARDRVFRYIESFVRETLADAESRSGRGSAKRGGFLDFLRPGRRAPDSERVEDLVERE